MDIFNVEEKWVTDVTEFEVKEQKVYLSPVVDLLTTESVAYKVAKNACLPLVTNMLTEAISTLKPNSKPIIHSDQGWQYRHRQYQKKVAESELTQSMSRKGNCLDNAVAENFFALLKTEIYYNQSFEDALIEPIKTIHRVLQYETYKSDLIRPDSDRISNSGLMGSLQNIFDWLFISSFSIYSYKVYELGATRFSFS
ncbi:DDE-type integrase/transposase/recombinase [Vibrio tasmaniensis]|uniref:DDE-type integrase/transposase/recombinase n=1 Tax=Vibrio tasmaniensis TaxID=212663 RepID=UPI00111A8773|nr:DDE-type integrase/transposase/recombinase [Vibrio tasmaniensis]